MTVDVVSNAIPEVSLESRSSGLGHKRSYEAGNDEVLLAM